MLDKHPAESEAAKLQQTQRNLVMLGGAIRVIEWTNDRPDELAAALLKLLDHKSAAMRRGAADFIGASARKVELKRFDPLEAFNSKKSTFSSLLPYIDPKGEAAKEPEEKPLPSKAFARLLERKAVAKLRYAVTMDADISVRAAARLALKHFAEVPEPVEIRPREVRP